MNVKAYYVALFSAEMDCYERYSVDLELVDAERLLKRKREIDPNNDWVILAILDV